MRRRCASAADEDGWMERVNGISFIASILVYHILLLFLLPACVRIHLFSPSSKNIFFSRCSLFKGKRPANDPLPEQKNWETPSTLSCRLMGRRKTGGSSW